MSALTFDQMLDEYADSSWFEETYTLEISKAEEEMHFEMVLGRRPPIDGYVLHRLAKRSVAESLYNGGLLQIHPSGTYLIQTGDTQS